MKLRSIITKLVPINIQMAVVRAGFVTENSRQLSSGWMWTLPNNRIQLRSLREITFTAASHIILNTRPTT